MKIVDFGKNFGKQKYLKDSTYNHNREILEALIEDLKKNFKEEDYISIADWGGGNAILSKDLLKFLPEYKNIAITVIDLDNSKFISHKRINNIEADISEYKPEEKFDYSIMRQVLHYNPWNIQKKILKNIHSNTKIGLLIENFFIEEERTKEWEKVNKGLKEILGINRYIPNLDELKKELKKSWGLVTDKKLKFSKSTVKEFHIDRFKIDEKYDSLVNKYFSDKLLPDHSIVWCKK